MPCLYHLLKAGVAGFFLFNSCLLIASPSMELVQAEDPPMSWALGFPALLEVLAL